MNIHGPETMQPHKCFLHLNSKLDARYATSRGRDELIGILVQTNVLRWSHLSITLFRALLIFLPEPSCAMSQFSRVGRPRFPLPDDGELRCVINSLWVDPPDNEAPSSSDCDYEEYSDDDWAIDNEDDIEDDDLEDGQPFPWPYNHSLYTHGIYPGVQPKTQPEHLIADEVRARATPMVKRIWESFHHLQAICKCQEAVILR